MAQPDRDPSIEFEPHLRQRPFRADPSETRADLSGEFDRRRMNADERVEHSVWDEPALASELTGGPSEGDVTYASWLTDRSARTSWLGSWTTALGMALLAGPLAVVAALMHNVAPIMDITGIFVTVLIAPLVEELVKIMLPLICVETRPYRFRTRVQLFVTIGISAGVFAAIENLMYLQEAVFDFTQVLTRWRWTVCVALHVGCSLIAGLGVARIWRTTMTDKTRPQVALAAPYFVTAMLIHGVYNAFAVVFSFIHRF